MLSDSPRKREKPSRPNRPANASTNRSWSDKQKMEAVQSYLVVGNVAMVSRILGIPEITLRVWRRSDWWKDAYNELKQQERLELSNRMKKIVGASLSVVEDRLLNGDFQFDQKTGEVVRKPVNMKDAHKVAIDLQDRQEHLEKLEVGPKINDDGIEARLLKLAEKFADMATKSLDQKIDEHRTIEMEDAVIVEKEDDAVHEEREA